MMTALNLRNFDADETVPRPRPAPVRTYSEDEVQRMVRAAHERGVAEGRAAGLEEGRAGAEASHDGLATEAMAAMTTALEELSGEAQAHRAALEAQVIEFAHSVCDTVFPELVEDLSRSRVAAQVRQGMKMEAMVTDLDCSTMLSRVGEEASPTSAWSEHLRGNAIAFRGWANLRTSCNGKGAAREILKRKTNGVIAGARRRQRELRGDADTNLGIDTSARSVAL